MDGPSTAAVVTDPMTRRDVRALEVVKRATLDEQERFGDALWARIVARRDPTANPENYGSCLADMVDIEPGDVRAAAEEGLGMDRFMSLVLE